MGTISVYLKILVLTISIIVLTITISFSQDVTLDNTFGDNGVVVTPNTYYINNIALFQDGRIIGLGNDAIARYLPDGTLDTNFGGEGIVFESESDVWKHDLIIQSDSKIIACGSSHHGFVEIDGTFYSVDSSYIVRYLENGSFDSTFGNNGIIKYGFEALSSEIVSIKQLSDDKLLAGVRIGDMPAVVKLNSSGSIDNSWANEGFVYFDTLDFFISGITLNFDESFFCYGIKYAGNNDWGLEIYNIVVFKFLHNGYLDTSFGELGMTKIEIDDGYANDHYVNKLILLDDNKLLLNRVPNKLIKLLPDGTLDPSFGDNGVTSFYFPNADIAVLDSGSIVVAGTKVISDGNYGYRLIRFYENGEMDSSFNDVGYYNIDITDEKDFLYCMTKQTDDKLILGGSSKFYGDSDFTLVRLKVSDATSSPLIENFNSKIKIFPNPVNNQLTISLKTEIIKKIVVYDNMGKQVMHKTVNLNEVTFEVKLNLGIYFCEIIMQSGLKEVKKIVVH